MEIKFLKNKLSWVLLGTFGALIPSYLIRYKEPIFMFLYNKLTTYPGDLWNFFFNYLKRGQTYPPEYPAGLRFFYEVMRFDRYENYTFFFTVNFLILFAFAAATSFVLYLLLKNRSEQSGQPASFKNLWYFWILAPSFIFYGTLNYDIPVVFLIVLSVYLFTKSRYFSSVFILALGVVVKVFPAFLLPLFIWKAPAKIRFWLVVFFGFVVFSLNLPYMLSDFEAWIFPYMWQISSNITVGPSQGTYWWIFYPITGKLTGWISLILFAGLYYFTCLKMKKADFFSLCLNVILLFVLTDRIYSPQYNLYLLPFLVLATYPIDKKVFYSMDSLNVLIVLFLFFLRNNTLYNFIIVVARYILLVKLFLSNYRNSRKQI